MTDEAAERDVAVVAGPVAVLGLGIVVYGLRAGEGAVVFAGGLAIGLGLRIARRHEPRAELLAPSP